MLAFLIFKNAINSNRLFILHLTCFHLMRCRWFYGCPSCNQQLEVTPAVVDSGLNKKSSKAGMMEGAVFIMIRPSAKGFARGNSLWNMDQCFLLDQCRGALLPKQEKTMDTIHGNLGLGTFPFIV